MGVGSSSQRPERHNFLELMGFIRDANIEPINGHVILARFNRMMDIGYRIGSNENGATLLHFAAQYFCGDAENPSNNFTDPNNEARRAIFNILVREADEWEVNALDSNGFSPMHYLLLFCDLKDSDHVIKACKDLMEKGAQLSAGAGGLLLLFLSSKAEEIAENGARVDAEYKRHMISICEFLLEKGLNPYERGDDGHTALDIAEGIHPDLREAILAKWRDLNEFKETEVTSKIPPLSAERDAKKDRLVEKESSKKADAFLIAATKRLLRNPAFLVCPISGSLMMDPVLTSVGTSYDKKNIKGKHKDQLTGNEITDELLENRGLKRVATSYFKRTIEECLEIAVELQVVGEGKLANLLIARAKKLNGKFVHDSELERKVDELEASIKRKEKLEPQDRLELLQKRIARAEADKVDFEDVTSLSLMTTPVVPLPANVGDITHTHSRTQIEQQATDPLTRTPLAGQFVPNYNFKLAISEFSKAMQLMALDAADAIAASTLADKSKVVAELQEKAVGMSRIFDERTKRRLADIAKGIDEEEKARTLALARVEEESDKAVAAPERRRSKIELAAKIRSSVPTVAAAAEDPLHGVNADVDFERAAAPATSPSEVTIPEGDRRRALDGSTTI